MVVQGDNSKPLPLEGGGAGVGVEVPAPGPVSAGADTELATGAATPIPGPSPLQGEGGRPTPAAKARALRLRKTETWGERIVWKALRERRMNFRRQAPVGPYVVDFAHFGSRLIVEIDGYHHTRPERQARDAARDAWFRTEGFRVLRVEESALKRDLLAVVEQIVAGTTPPPSPTLPLSKGKGEKRYDPR